MERHDAVRGALRSREPIFHRPEHATTRTAFEAMATRRLSVWREGDAGCQRCQVLYHQGTLVCEASR